MKLGLPHTTTCGCLRIAAHRIDGLPRPYSMTFVVGEGRAASFTSHYALIQKRGDLLEAAQDACEHCFAIDEAYRLADLRADPDLITAAHRQHNYSNRQARPYNF